MSRDQDRRAQAVKAVLAGAGTAVAAYMGIAHGLAQDALIAVDGVIAGLMVYGTVPVFKKSLKWY